MSRLILSSSSEKHTAQNLTFISESDCLDFFCSQYDGFGSWIVLLDFVCFVLKKLCCLLTLVLGAIILFQGKTCLIGCAEIAPITAKADFICCIDAISALWSSQVLITIYKLSRRFFVLLRKCIKSSLTVHPSLFNPSLFITSSK